jgi:hypothetical protein
MGASPEQMPHVVSQRNRQSGAARPPHRPFWLMHRVRAAIPPTSPLASAEFATIRERLIKVAARVIEHIARIRVHQPTSCPEAALFRSVALGSVFTTPLVGRVLGRIGTRATLWGSLGLAGVGLLPLLTPWRRSRRGFGCGRRCYCTFRKGEKT